MFAAKLREHAVFSAHAEVVPYSFDAAYRAGGILRARGGSSGMEVANLGIILYSPRTRR